MLSDDKEMQAMVKRLSKASAKKVELARKEEAKQPDPFKAVLKEQGIDLDKIPKTEKD